MSSRRRRKTRNKNIASSIQRFLQHLCVLLMAQADKWRAHALFISIVEHEIATTIPNKCSSHEDMAHTHTTTTTTHEANAIHCFHCWPDLYGVVHRNPVDGKRVQHHTHTSARASLVHIHTHWHAHQQGHHPLFFMNDSLRSSFAFVETVCTDVNSAPNTVTPLLCSKNWDFFPSFITSLASLSTPICANERKRQSVNEQKKGREKKLTAILCVKSVLSIL